MKQIKDIKIILLISILTIFTISYFVIANKVSYAFVTDTDVNVSYNNLMKTIEEGAKVYASKNTDIFTEDNIAYIKVQDLIDNNLIAPNDNGNIVNPLDKDDILNSKIIKIKKENDNLIVEIDK